MEGTAAGEDPRPVSERRSEVTVVRVGLALSVVAHVALVAFVAFPRPEAVVDLDAPRELRYVDVPPLVDIPPRPEPIQRPRTPQLSRVDVGEAVVPSGEPRPPAIALSAPEPPRVAAASMEERPVFAPPEVAPSLEAPDHFRERLERSYPRLLRDRGVGGVVELRFFVDPSGGVSHVRVAQSSGHGSLDRVAERMAGEMEFLPALNRDRAVGVWVAQRICFVTVEDPGEDLTAAECEHRVTLGGP